MFYTSVGTCEKNVMSFIYFSQTIFPLIPKSNGIILIDPVDELSNPYASYTILNIPAKVTINTV